MEKSCASTNAFLEKSESGSNSGETDTLKILLSACGLFDEGFRVPTPVKNGLLEIVRRKPPSLADIGSVLPRLSKIRRPPLAQ